MNIRDLAYFVAVFEKRHFGIAAQACNVSQPALSAQIKKLESELGITLFERGTRQVMPTEAANAIIGHARLILEKSDDLKRHCRYLREGPEHKLINLGVIPTVAPYYLPEFLKAVGSHFGSDELRWQIHEDKTNVLLDKFEDKRIDAAIMVLPRISGDYHYKELFQEDLLVAVPKGHGLSSAKEVDPDDIDSRQMLLLDDGHCLNESMMRICGRMAGGGSFRAASLETLRHMVACKAGITIMPAKASRKGDGLSYIPIKNSKRYRRIIGLLWRRDSMYEKELKSIASIF